MSCIFENRLSNRLKVAYKLAYNGFDVFLQIRKKDRSKNDNDNNTITLK